MNHSGGTLPAIRQTQLLNAPIAKVWDAVATSEGIAAWFMPNTFEPVLDSEFVLKAGPFGDSPCKVTELDPPRRLSFTWGKDWTLTFELAEKDGKTEFTLIHDGWDPDKVTEFGETHALVRERMSQGWGGIGTKLAALVEG
ncbi:SRPBCC family protein [Paenibacillus ginsengarvi]|uniref:SRPBCC domain-containing protein n=1 Tax=Paenibacillus ginsengarvi TaxID=400777 RepID=A0A3B0C8W2_9BACL|nr:SRPBCC domain-containing protein [Paenibacillus ginsengarvi]RKN79236.1 SRPBCC domain-containing protein [Paenibacillus ginsengarvi]